jgi:hypothetical protein
MSRGWVKGEGYYQQKTSIVEGKRNRGTSTQGYGLGENRFDRQTIDPGNIAHGRTVISRDGEEPLSFGDAVTSPKHALVLGNRRKRYA